MSSSVVPIDGGPDVAIAPDTPVTTPPDAVVPVPPDVSVRRDSSADASDAPLSCTPEAAASVSIRYSGPGGATMDCTPPRGVPPGEPSAVITRTAAVVDVSDDATGATVGLDFCSPAADCVPLIGSLRIEAPGFTLGASPAGLRRGQYVQIRSRATWSWGCTMQVEVSNAPSWDGSPNPVRHDSSLLAAAASGEAAALTDAPFGVSRQSIGCAMPGTDCGGGRPELFALAFQGHCNTCEVDPPPVVVAQGHTGWFGINGLSYIARDLRSFNTGACDDYWNYAWTAREVWLE